MSLCGGKKKKPQAQNPPAFSYALVEKHRDPGGSVANRQQGSKEEKVPQRISSNAGVKQAATELERGISCSGVRQQAAAGDVYTA